MVTLVVQQLIGNVVVFVKCWAENKLIAVQKWKMTYVVKLLYQWRKYLEIECRWICLLWNQRAGKRKRSTRLLCGAGMEMKWGLNASYY